MSDKSENDPSNDAPPSKAEIDEIINEIRAGCESFEKKYGPTIRRNHYLQTALFDAIRNNQPEFVKLLLERGANANVQDDFGRAPLHLATERSLTQIISILTEAGADAELKTKDGKTPLDLARRRNHPKIERMLREAKRKRIMRSDIYELKEGDIETFDGIQRFAHAVADADIEAVRLLIEKGADVNKSVSDGGRETLLHIAVDRNHPEIVAVLLQAGADVNAVDYDGETPLHRAALNSPASVPLLISAGANVDAQDNIHDSPLHYAAECNSLDTIAALIDAGATIDLPGYGGRTALFEAVFHENVEATELLLERGANVNHRIKLSRSKADGETPIHVAALYANMEIMATLIDAGADIETKSVRGKKAIDHAIHEKKTDLVIYLIKRGAEVPDLIDYAGKKSLWAQAELWYKGVKNADKVASDTNDLEQLCRAIRQGKTEAVMVLLLKRRTNLNAFDKHGYAPLHWAALEGNIEIIAALLDFGAEMEVGTGKGSPAMQLAAWRFMLNTKRTEKGLPVAREATLEALRFLLKRGAKVDAVNEVGYSLLHVAAQNGEIEIMQILLDAGADLELPDAHGKTPLFHAAGPAPYSYDAVKFLIDCGAKINVRDKEHGRTPLHWAGLCRAFRIINAMLEAGADRNLKDDKGKTALGYARK